MPASTTPTLPDPRQILLELAAPGWLAQALAPWRVEAAALGLEGGVELALTSDKARVPIYVEAAPTLAIAVRDPRIPAAKATSFVRALTRRLAASAQLRPWLSRLSELAAILTGRPSAGPDAGPDAEPDAELGELAGAWRSWPTRDSSPGRQVPALPEGVRELELGRAARAALILHRFARAELLAGLVEWEGLPAADPRPSFVEHLVDALALAILGRRGEALATLARASEAASEARELLAIARAHETLEDRPGAVAAHERVIAARGEPWDRLRLARARGDFAEAESIPAARPGARPSERVSFAREIVKVLEGAGRYDEALEVLADLREQVEDPAQEIPSQLALWAAGLHQWRVEPEAARAWLAVVEAHADAEALADERAAIEGALDVLEGEPARGLATLEATQASGATRLEILLWKAEALLALGRPEQALACVDEHILAENTLVAYLLKLLALAHIETAEALARSAESRTFLDGLVLDVLPSMCPAPELAAAREDPKLFIGLVRGLLDDMGGNRSPKPTWCRRGDDGQRRLEPVRVRPSGREASVTNLIRIRTEAPEPVLAGFDEVAAEYPTSPHPFTYGGELMIWLGRYRDALANFVEGDTRSPTRWSYVGRAAAHDLLHEVEDAELWSVRGAERFGELASATTHVYRGERLRRLEQWDAAARDLEIAVRHKPRRIGARINLALVHRARGDEAGWERELARLQADAPAFMFEAGARPGAVVDEALLLRCLERMVGNRSSFLHTMVDDAGRFRVVPNPTVWIGYARLSLALGRAALGPELLRRWLG